MQPRLTLVEAKTYLPDWTYLIHPVVTTIPNDRAPQAVFDKFLNLVWSSLEPARVANDLAEPPPRISTLVSRIVRDTCLARDIKRLHNYECQICGETIDLPNGARYAEAHHIQPLGKDHLGLDVEGNILCVCPNHHAELDLGARRLTIDELHIIPGHTLKQEYLDYHNREIYEILQ